jgi:hypothetical protein
MSQKAKTVLLVSGLSLCYPVSEEVFRSWNYFPARLVERRGNDQKGCETEHCVELFSGAVSGEARKGTVTRRVARRSTVWN